MKFLITLSILFHLRCGAQFFDTIPLSKKLRFVKQLHDSRQTGDAAYFLHYLNTKYDIDSLKLYEARLLLEQRLGKSADTLLVSIKEKTHDPSILCRAGFMSNHIILLNGSGSLSAPCTNDSLKRDLWRIQMMSSAILEGNDEKFNLIFNSGRCYHPILSLIEFDLYVINAERTKRPKKNAALASLLSALFPGTGKLYAGKPHEAFHTFLPVALNAVQAAEGYYYKGFMSPHFYFFGSVAAVFYTSNIVGSARAARRYNAEKITRTRNDVEYELSKLLKYY